MKPNPAEYGHIMGAVAARISALDPNLSTEELAALRAGYHALQGAMAQLGAHVHRADGGKPIDQPLPVCHAAPAR